MPTAGGTLTASTAGSAFDTVLALYSGSSLTALTRLGCNDDYGHIYTTTAGFDAILVRGGD